MKTTKKKYEQVGSYTQCDKGQYRFVGGCGEDGIAYFKSEEDFIKRPYSPCYVPNGVFNDERYITHNEQGDAEYIITNEYETYKTLLEKCRYNERLCQVMFHELNWQHPDTWLNEWGEENIAEFYDFVKVGNYVFWNWPAFAEIPVGFYEITEINSDPKDWTWNTTIWLKTKDIFGEEILIEALLNEISQTDIKFKLEQWEK